MSKQSSIDLRRNLAVPEPDFSNALVAIDNVIGSKQKSLKESISKKTADMPKSMKRSEAILDHNMEVLHDALGQLHNSLSGNLKRLTNPVLVEDYGEILRQQPHQNISKVTPAPKVHSYLDLLEADSIISDDSDDSLLNIDDLIFSSSDEEDDADDDMFIDKEAQSRAIELREKVREEAKSLQQLQIEVPQLAIGLAKREMELFRKQMDDTNKYYNIQDSTKNLSRKLFGSEQNSDIEFQQSDRQPNDLNNHDEYRDNNDVNENFENVKVMQDSFKRLTLTLMSVERTLPDQLDGLQETIHTIEESVDKRLRMKSDDSEVPAIERAILSKENVAHKNSSNEGNVENKPEILTPEKRLAMFLAK